ncbi:MAG: hypothetical protein V2I67_02495 [Thermoanaerobaculales bacterium]|jgi:hypothetical protein|nr:hypothetical protein [Thermoanaerobaculales bacterium]
MMHRNDLTIWVYHLKRGGGHAIVNWIARNFDRQVFHLNNAFSKPLKVRWRGERIFRRITDPERFGGPGQRLYNVELPTGTNWRDVAAMPKEVLLTNVENFPLAKVPGEALLGPGADRYIGSSRERRTVLVLRDPYNTFASVWKSKRRMRNRLHRFYRSEWKAYAREFLGETSFLPPDTIMVSFNQWFSDQEYRRDLAGKLGLDAGDRGIQEVSSDGGGSSFSGREHQGRASEMKVLERWRVFEDDPRYAAAFDDETVELSRKIFGDITGGAPR